MTTGIQRKTTTAKLATAVAGAAILLTGTANAALIDGFGDDGYNTSVFISLVERNASNEIVRNLVIDTGARTLQTFAGTPWSTTEAQETQILAFLGSSTGTVRFNVGGALNDASFASDLFGFLTSGNATGPGPEDYTALATGQGNIDTFIGNANNGTFSAAGILAANGPAAPGWHNNAWNNSVGGAIQPSNEILFGQISQLVGWKIGNTQDFLIVRQALGGLTSNALTGDISFNTAVVPLPATVWLLGSAVAFLSRYRRRVLATA